MLRKNIIWFCLLIGVMVTACSISYKFNGASIDYTKVKTISIADFQNRAEYVYAPLATEFNQKMKDMFIQQTRLQLVNSGGDLEIDGEITGYNQYNESAVKEDAWSSQTKLTITVRVRYSNRTNPDEDFEQSFSAYREFDATRMLQDVQAELCTEIIDELTDQIYNATVANW